MKVLGLQVRMVTGDHEKQQKQLRMKLELRRYIAKYYQMKKQVLSNNY